jgi:hypothetical protein
MAQAFYERFSNRVQTESFSTDAIFTQFSATDQDYQDANCAQNPSSGCNPSADATTDACKCLYKEKVDQLAKLGDLEKRSQKSLDDEDQVYAARSLDIINISIGISIMLLSIYYMNE